MLSQTSTSFINCIGCDIEDSIHFDARNSIVMNGGMFEIVEGLILVPYNILTPFNYNYHSGVMYLGLNTGNVLYDIPIDSVGYSAVLYCEKRDDSTSFLIGSTTIYEGNGIVDDTVVTWIGILDHNDLSIILRQNFQYPNSRHTTLRGLIYNSDSSITAIGTMIDPMYGIGKNIKVEISADLSSATYQAYNNASSFPTGNGHIDAWTIRRLTNGNILYSGYSHCMMPDYPFIYNVGIEQINDNTYPIWARDYQSCDSKPQGFSILTLDDDSFYAFREVIEASFTSIQSSYIEVLYFDSNKSIIDSFAIRTSEEMNKIVCPPVMDLDSNIICMTWISDSTLSGLSANYPIGRVVKFDRQGNILWYKDINYFKNEWGSRVMREWMNSISVLPNGDVIVSGRIVKGGNTSLPNYQDNYIIVERITTNGCTVNDCADYYLNVTEADTPKYTCYPNPTNGILHLDLNIYDTYNISLLDMSGRLLNTFTVQGNLYDINMSMYKNGVYFLSIDNGKSWKTEKIVLNR